ncbi:response regulator [bacterium]|nr:response regulator [bacterium]
MSLSDPPRILVLEDDADLLLLLREVLGDEGYQVTTASSGSEAILLASQQPFDLLVTDVRMPGVDGLEALKQVRNHLPNLDSLVVSGYTTEAETLRALQLNVGGYLKKPFSLTDLLQTVRQLLQQREAEKQRRQDLVSLQRSLSWSLHSACQSFCSQAFDSGQLAFYLARQLQLSLEQAQHLRLTAMINWPEMRKLQQLPGFTRLDRLGLGPCWELLNGPQDDLPAQILRAVRWLCESEEGPDFAHCPQDFSPALGQLLSPDLRHSTEVLAEQAMAEYEQGEHRRQAPMLALARTLEQQGHSHSAREAYQRLLDQAEAEGTLQIQVLLGLARTGWHASLEGWYDQLKQAERLSRALSPSLGAEIRWSIARLLRASNHSSTAQYLAQLEQEFAQLGRPLDQAKARLAGKPDGSSLAAAHLLLLPQHRVHLHSETDWLIEALWQLSPQSQAGPQWCRLAGEFPRQTLAWAATAGAACEVLLQSLEAHPHLAPGPLVEALASRPQAGGREAELRGRVQAGPGPLYLRFCSLGNFEVSVNGQRVSEKLFKTQKFRYLLAYLVARRGQAVSEDLLVEEFWPNSKDSGKSSIYAATTAIRRALRQPGGEHDILQREGDQLRLSPELAVWHDLEEFEQGVAHFGQNLETDRQTLQLYTGPYLQGCYLDWALRQRAQCEEKLLRCLHSLATRQLEHDPHQSAEMASQGLEIDPLSQELHALKIRAYLSLGQPEKGIRQFQQCAQVLRRELGIEPLTSLLELHERCRLALP